MHTGDGLSAFTDKQAQGDGAARPDALCGGCLSVEFAGNSCGMAIK